VRVHLFINRTTTDCVCDRSFEKELAAVEGGDKAGSGTGTPAAGGSDDEGAGADDVPAPEGEVRPTPTALSFGWISSEQV
jgi:hypothetical protein